MDVYSSNREKIVLTDDAFSSGGEGEVRTIISAPSKFKDACVKIYYFKKRTSELEKKIKFMVANPPAKVKGDGFLIGWPLDYVSDTSGSFLGFIMPLAFPNSEQLIKLTAPKLSKKMGQEWFDRYDRTKGVPALISRLKLINNISIPIHLLHSTNKYVLRDFKPENILITYNGFVTLVDMDSVQISNRGKLLFSGTAATPNYIPPEYYNSNVGKTSTYLLDKSWDNFAIGVVFYQILLGLHPYVVTPCNQKDSNCNEIFQNIAQNLFPFGPNANKVKSYPDLHDKFNLLHPTAKALFLRAFSSVAAHRPTAEEWGKCIHALISPAPTPRPNPGPIPTPKPKPGPVPPPKPKPISTPTKMSDPIMESAFWLSLFSFSGRNRRSYFWFTIIVSPFIHIALLLVLAGIIGKGNSTIDYVAILIDFSLLWTGLANCSKRLHDLGMSAAWIIALIIPFYNLYLLFKMAFIKGECNDNKYGLSPY